MNSLLLSGAATGFFQFSFSNPFPSNATINYSHLSVGLVATFTNLAVIGTLLLVAVGCLVNYTLIKGLQYPPIFVVKTL